VSRARTLHELAGPTVLAQPSTPAVGSAFQPKGLPMRSAVQSSGVPLSFQAVVASGVDLGESPPVQAFIKSRLKPDAIGRVLVVGT
jgi:hypothetical protein